jgi:outer membrane protein
MKPLLSALFVFVATLSHSQGGWTLQQCIDYAVKNNLSVKQSELNIKVNKNNLNQSKAGTLPSLNAGATHTYNFGRTIDRYTNSFANQMVLSQNFYLATSVTLWSGLSQYNNIKQNELTYKASVETVNQQRNDLSLNVATAFLQVVYSEQMTEVSKNQVKISNEQLERTQKLADAGTVAQSNVYDVKAQLASDQYNLTTSENNYKIALLTLQQLLNLDTLKNFNISKPEIELSGNLNELANVMDVYTTALKNQPAIKSAELSMRAAEKGLLVAKGGISPTLSLSASLGTGYSGLDQLTVSSTYLYYPAFTSTFDTVLIPQQVPTETRNKPFADQFKNNVNKSIGFQLNIPLFNGLKTHTNVANAKLNVFNQKLNYDIARQQLFKNIAQAHANALAAFDKFSSAKLAVEAAEASFKFTETKYNAGSLSAFDFSNAKNRLLKAQADLLNSKFDYIFRVKVLDYYQGKPLSF